MANLTLQIDLVEKMRKDALGYQTALQRNLELELVAEIKRASRGNYKNRTGRLWRTQRRIMGVGARIGSRHAPYWQYLDNFTRGRGRFVTALLDSPGVRDRITKRAIERTNRERGN